MHSRGLMVELDTTNHLNHLFKCNPVIYISAVFGPKNVLDVLIAAPKTVPFDSLLPRPRCCGR